ncbi:hypothetical protein FRC00_012008 [Tulasnella sp. 408]|nr:hypothetical protein FRC00_012008 [Tulasnella sp. 408]
MEAGDYPTVKAIPKDSEGYLTVKAKSKEKEKHLPDTDDFVQSPLDINPSALSTDEFYTPRPIFAAPKEYVEVVVRDHLEEILNLFVFPSSRTQLRTMLAKAGFLDEETNDAASAMLPTTPSQPEFWTRRPHSPSPSSSEHTPSKSPSPSVSRLASRKKGKRPASGSSDIDPTKPTSRDHTRCKSASEGELGSSAERTDEPGKKKLSAPDGSLYVAALE